MAFKSYVNGPKHAAFQDASQEILREVAREMGVELVGGGDRRAMRQALASLPPAEQTAAYESFGQVEAAAQPRIDAEVAPDVPPVDVSDFVDHIDYLVDLIGIEHVGISSDFDGGGGVEGWMDASETFNVTLELVRRGYSEEEIALLWSGNLLRVLDEAQAVAAQIQAEG